MNSVAFFQVVTVVIQSFDELGNKEIIQKYHETPVATVRSVMLQTNHAKTNLSVLRGDVQHVVSR